MPPKLISRNDARKQLLEKSHLNSIQIDKVLGTRDKVPEATIKMVLAISDGAERFAKRRQAKAKGTVKDNIGDAAAPNIGKARALGAHRKKAGEMRAGGERQTMDSAIKRAVKFVDEEALM